jgi:hypothetical protein
MLKAQADWLLRRATQGLSTPTRAHRGIWMGKRIMTGNNVSFSEIKSLSLFFFFFFFFFFLSFSLFFFLLSPLSSLLSPLLCLFLASRCVSVGPVVDGCPTYTPTPTTASSYSATSPSKYPPRPCVPLTRSRSSLSSLSSLSPLSLSPSLSSHEHVSTEASIPS